MTAEWPERQRHEGRRFVRPALHTADDPPFFVFYIFSCVFVFCVVLCVFLFLCGSSKATLRCYTSVCYGNILPLRGESWGGLDLWENCMISVYSFQTL